MIQNPSNIELKAQQLLRDPDLSGGNNVAAAFSETTCCIYYFLQNSDEIGKLTFDAKSYRSVRTDCNPYLPGSSFLLEVIGSNWTSEMDNWVYKSSRYDSWFLEYKREIKHFAISASEIYHEVLATGFSESYLDESCDEHKFALQILGGRP